MEAGRQAGKDFQFLKIIFFVFSFLFSSLEPIWVGIFWFEFDQTLPFHLFSHIRLFVSSLTVSQQD